MALFRLDSSIRTEGSISREVADVVEDAWVGHVVRRDIGLNPLPSDAWAAAVAGSYVPEDARTPAQRQALALAATLADELLAADAILLAVPLYNLGVSQHFKTWVDLIITDPRAAAGGPVCWWGRKWCCAPCAAAPTARAPRGRAGITRPANSGAFSAMSSVPT